MAAGTAAALVPIRSITRESRSETSTYIPADSEEPGPVCAKLLSTLKGIQLGKIKDTFGWNSKVNEVDVKNYAPGEVTNGVNAEHVDKLP
jgi:branched-chain amino acid aminotransferase